MKTEMTVLFKSMQKDDKKEVLKFEIKGSEDVAAETELFNLSGSIVVLNIDGCAAGDVTAEFISMQRDSKKTVMKFGIKGDSDEKAQQLYKRAGCNVKLSVQPSQMSIDEYYDEPHEGIKYSTNPDGTVDVDQDQVDMDEIEHEEDLEDEDVDDSGYSDDDLD
ncbi:hypothetical protein E0485_14675 [Paenibacillus albiflavus]|uniref:Uncharacterized protein n=1 Tax=Paenibacillus albiflavus TaxID=2545760 RepID=A0A4R4EDL7_9BACL|nr:hypothetical protein [Paenibacillus albiflavus]TCZ76088.1 hypothetical protein E0485_14675 [Paenibacillus albiflavus]